MAKYKPREILLGYHKPEGGSGMKFISANITGGFTLGMRGSTAGRLAKFSDRVSRRISYTSTRSYGMFLMSYGFLSMLIHFVKDYLGYYERTPIGILITCAVISAVAVPLLVFDKPLCLALQDFPPTDYLFFEFFCIKRMDYTKERGIHPMIALSMGIVLAILGVFVPALWVMLGFAALVYVYLTFISPEFSFLLIFLAIPYLPLLSHPGHVLAAAVGVTLISFGRKVFQGKRVYYFEQYDLLIYLFIAAVAVGGVLINGGSAISGALVMCLLTGGYILASCLITNRRLADCAIKAVVISSVPVALFSVIYFVLNVIKYGRDGIHSVSATFDTPAALAVFLLISAALSCYFIIESKGGERVAYIFILMLVLAALVTTLELFALVAAVAGVIAYGLAKVRKTSGVLLAVTALLPYGVLLLPRRVLEFSDSLPILSHMRLVRRAEIFTESGRMFLNNLLFGVGVGEECFSSEMVEMSGIKAQNSGSFLLGIGCEMGVIALVVFLLIILVRIIHRIIYMPYVRSSQVSRICRFTSSVEVALFAFGAISYIWADMTMFYTFFCIFGIASATLRISKREFDDRVGYYRDGSGSESSNIDIVIR